MTHAVAAHPRVCGENDSLQEGEDEGDGSSPRVRGKLEFMPTLVQTIGLIPACAGKTMTTKSSTHQAGAHPRVCGENPTSSRCQDESPGSSPRVRGKRGVDEACLDAVRLIPACAGKTVPKVAVVVEWGAHPRVCGENRLAGGPTTLPTGSSPRVRGKLVHVPVMDGERGLIPACAGKTSYRSR